MPISANIRAKIRASIGSSSEIVPLKSNRTARGGVSSATRSTIRHRHRDAPQPTAPTAGWCSKATLADPFGRLETFLADSGFAVTPGASADAGTMVADLYLGYGLAATLRRGDRRPAA